MHRTTVIMLCLAGASLVGCAHDDAPPKFSYEDYGTLNAGMLDHHYVESVDLAVIRQQTLYPYHFRTGTDELTELGRRDAAILAAHYREHPGTLNVRRGPEGDGLYQARLEAVRGFMSCAGVAVERIAIDDGMPGGDGMASNRVIRIQERAAQAPAPAPRPASGGSGILSSF